MTEIDPVKLMKQEVGRQAAARVTSQPPGCAANERGGNFVE
jgi:hypothetical protein